MTTAKLAVAQLKSIIKDYNYWGESESDSPLLIAKVKGTKLAQEKFLSLDRKLRIEAETGEDLSLVNRATTTETLDEVFLPLIQNSASPLSGLTFTTSADITDSLEMQVEALEYYVQLYNVFKTMINPQVSYVSITNAPSSHKTIVIEGGFPEIPAVVADPTATPPIVAVPEVPAETVYAYGLLTQT